MNYLNDQTKTLTNKLNHFNDYYKQSKALFSLCLSLPNDHQNVQYLEDGTIEVTDTLSKEEYYKSLRRRCTTGNSQNTRQYGLSSQLSLETSQCGTLRSGFGKRKGTLHDFKPSGKEELCYILMLEGVEKTYTIDVS
ncbi:unnamed protein product [Schistosoma curassoni]|uniref:Uncharacterized protein n=1 Tax=Schistosoma curassoni TaxID=6186 RepID=A0A183JCU6_9TREM|nr:unnamed protein product [Schistosoma curassoni]